MGDALGDRMKLYEQMEAGRCLMPRLPILCRLDGRAFHTLTRGMPAFHAPMMNAMEETTRRLVEEEPEG